MVGSFSGAGRQGVQLGSAQTRHLYCAGGNELPRTGGPGGKGTPHRAVGLDQCFPIGLRLIQGRTGLGASSNLVNAVGFLLCPLEREVQYVLSGRLCVL